MRIARLAPVPIVLSLALLAFAAATPGAAEVQRQERPLEALSFMAGCWRGDGGVDRSIEEQWTAANSTVMLAMTRYVDDNDGRTRGWEFSRITADSAGIVLVPMPMGRAQGQFRLTTSVTGSATFEDPAHDFPKRITYRREGRTLVAHLDGGAGSQHDMMFEMASVPCPAPAEQ